MPGDRAVLERAALLRRGELRRRGRAGRAHAVRARRCGCSPRATPVVAAVQGAAIGGGLGLALSADLRVASPSSRFAANFARLGIHHGFGMTVTLPAAIGDAGGARAALHRAGVSRARRRTRLGLCDRLASDERLRERGARAGGGDRRLGAAGRARDPQTMRGELAERVRAATEREHAEQAALFATRGLPGGRAARRAERRPPRFSGR